jgi:hypothetical protein
VNESASLSGFEEGEAGSAPLGTQANAANAAASISIIATVFFILPPYRRIFVDIMRRFYKVYHGAAAAVNRKEAKKGKAHPAKNRS